MSARAADLFTDADRAFLREHGYLVSERVFAGEALDRLRGAVEDACGRVVEAARSKHKEVVFGGAVAFTEIPELGVRNLVWEGEGLDVPKVVEPMTQVDERLRELWRHRALTALATTALGVEEVAPFTDKFNAKRARAGGSGPPVKRLVACSSSGHVSSQPPSRPPPPSGSGARVAIVAFPPSSSSSICASTRTATGVHRSNASRKTRSRSARSSAPS